MKSPWVLCAVWHVSMNSLLLLFFLQLVEVFCPVSNLLWLSTNSCAMFLFILRPRIALLSEHILFTGSRCCDKLDTATSIFQGSFPLSSYELQTLRSLESSIITCVKLWLFKVSSEAQAIADPTFRFLLALLPMWVYCNGSSVAVQWRQQLCSSSTKV